jgi:hypothetical protein
MGHLASFRSGWENENLATYVLSRFAFIARPSSVADDVGSDFFCTLFEVKRQQRHDYLSPRSSFAIQIKSNTKPVDVSNKIEYLWNLEIPFFVGVVNREAWTLTIFSGEHIPLLFSHKGKPKKLALEPCDRTDLDRDLASYFAETGPKAYRLRFPRVVEVDPRSGAGDPQATAEVMSRICSVMYDNIASRRNGEYVFDIVGSDPPSVVTFAGSASVKVFRTNFLKRLAEAFHNLKWIREHRPNEFRVQEFRAYERLFQDLEELYAGSMPPFVAGPYSALQALVGGDEEEERERLAEFGSYWGVSESDV